VTEVTIASSVISGERVLALTDVSRAGKCRCCAVRVGVVPPSRHHEGHPVGAAGWASSISPRGDAPPARTGSPVGGRWS
jgi:hypothetical protein